MCAVDDCPPWDFCNESEPTARKPHRCTECARDIRVGEKYRRIEGSCDGYFNTHKICRHCDALSAFMVRMCDGWPLNSLRHELVEHWWDGYRSISLGRWIAQMKRRWHDGKDPVPTGCGDEAHRLMDKAVA